MKLLKEQKLSEKQLIEEWLEKTKIINRVTSRLQKQYRIDEAKFY